jgi:hypothetical protein
MPKTSKTVALENFRAKHSSVLAEDDLQKIGPPPRSLYEPASLGLNSLPTELSAYFDSLTKSHDFQLVRQLQQWWLVRLLNAAARESCPEAYREFLEELLIRLDVEPPDGVLVPHRRARGAPIKKSTEEIYQTWIGLCKCSPGQLAFHVYGSSYTAANTKERKILRDRCRQAVERYKKRAT